MPMAKPFLMSDGVGVGYGARPTADGIDAVYFVAQENYPVEFLELGYPVRLLRYGINRDSGGAGEVPRRRRRGARIRGAGGTRRAVDADRQRGEPALGRRPAACAAAPVARWSIPARRTSRTLAPLSDGTVLRRGDILLLETGGGGGHGHPFDRPAEQVLQDVRDGFVSVEAARRDYGVVDRAAMPWTKRRQRTLRGDAVRRRRRSIATGYVDAIG